MRHGSSRRLFARCGFALTWLAIVLAFHTTPLAAEERAKAAGNDEAPTAEELIALTPVLDTSTDKYKSFEVAGRVGVSEEKDDAASFKFRMLYRAPDRYRLEVTDGADDTPLVIISDQKLIIYDPIGNAVLYSEKFTTDFALRQEGKGVSVKWQWNGGSPMEHPTKFFIDLKAMADGDAKSREVTKLADGEYRVHTITQLGNTLITDVTLNQTCPCKKIEHLEKDTGRQSFVMDVIAVNLDIPDQRFAMPSREKLAEKMEVTNLLDSDAVKVVKGALLIFRACFGRLGVNNPKMRDSLKSSFVGTIDWEKVKENDAMFSKALKELIPASPSDENRDDHNATESKE